MRSGSGLVFCWVFDAFEMRILYVVEMSMVSLEEPWKTRSQEIRWFWPQTTSVIFRLG